MNIATEAAIIAMVIVSKFLIEAGVFTDVSGGFLHINCGLSKVAVVSKLSVVNQRDCHGSVDRKPLVLSLIWVNPLIGSQGVAFVLWRQIEYR